MRNIYVFWAEFNGLEFVTYILIPSSILLVVLIYLYFNIRLLKLSFDFDISVLAKIDKNLEEKHNAIKKILDIYYSKYCKTDECNDKEKI